MDHEENNFLVQCLTLLEAWLTSNIYIISKQNKLQVSLQILVCKGLKKLFSCTLYLTSAVGLIESSLKNLAYNITCSSLFLSSSWAKLAIYENLVASFEKMSLYSNCLDSFGIWLHWNRCSWESEKGHPYGQRLFFP